jgi:hypothetical protein
MAIQIPVASWEKDTVISSQLAIRCLRRNDTQPEGRAGGKRAVKNGGSAAADRAARASARGPRRSAWGPIFGRVLASRTSLVQARDRCLLFPGLRIGLSRRSVSAASVNGSSDSYRSRRSRRCLVVSCPLASSR